MALEITFTTHHESSDVHRLQEALKVIYKKMNAMNILSEDFQLQREGGGSSPQPPVRDGA